VKIAGAAAVATAASKLSAAPALRTVHAANNQVQFGMVGTGSRGTYLLKHLTSIDSGRCVALCDIDSTNLQHGVDTIGNKPKTYKDYRELLADKDVEAVFVTVPLYVHFPITRDALLAGKHVFCEKSMVFKPEELHQLRALSEEHNKQVLQVGLQRRYSHLYQAARQMIEKGLIGEVTHVHAQWHRNPGWRMKGDPNNPEDRKKIWRLFREYSGGLVAELASHQVDVADWMLGMTPESVRGLGTLDFMKDGRDIPDNVQLIYKYPKGRRMVWTSIPTCAHLPYLEGKRTEMGELIMGTGAAIHITVGDDRNMPIALWYREPNPPKVEKAKDVKDEKFVAGATMVAASGSKGLPILLDRDLIDKDKDSFLAKEMKYARQWLYTKGIVVPTEPVNPVDTELDSFFNDCRTGGRPKADVEVGLADSTAVMLANIAMYEDRVVNFSEINEMGGGPVKKADTPVTA
jgi:predicted dehydrogenase